MSHIIYIFRSAEAREHGFVQAAIQAPSEEKAKLIAAGFAFTRIVPPEVPPADPLLDTRTFAERRAAAPEAPEESPAARIAALPRYTPSNIDGNMEQCEGGGWLSVDDVARAIAER